VLGANDGILSTASLVPEWRRRERRAQRSWPAGSAGLVAGALLMAAGEYVSVSSQRGAEQADIRLEQRELSRDPDGELRELAGLYERRGLPPVLARSVAWPCPAEEPSVRDARRSRGGRDARRARTARRDGSASRGRAARRAAVRVVAWASSPPPPV